MVDFLWAKLRFPVVNPRRGAAAEGHPLDCLSGYKGSTSTNTEAERFCQQLQNCCSAVRGMNAPFDINLLQEHIQNQWSDRLSWCRLQQFPVLKTVSEASCMISTCIGTGTRPADVLHLLDCRRRLETLVTVITKTDLKHLKVKDVLFCRENVCNSTG